MTDEPKEDAPVPADAGGDDDGGAGGAGGTARPARPVGRIVRIGCIVLALIGGVTLAQGGALVLDPDSAVCRQARADLDREAEDEADDQRDDDASELTDDQIDDQLEERKDEIDDTPCAAAITEAEALDDGDDVPSEGAARNTGIVFALIGLAQLVVAILLMRRPNRQLRIAALVTAAVGILAPALAFFSIILVMFVVYALGFSSDSKAVFGAFGRGRAKEE